MEIRLDGKTALVTGASSGLGERFAQVLAESGARVAIAARRMDRLKELRASIESAGGECCAVSIDVTDVASIEAGIATIERDFGAIDVLVNNSGVSITKRLGEYSEADFDRIMATNLKGAFFVAQTVGARMIAAKRPGRIINIASTAGLRPVRGIGVYSMSKAGVISMTHTMALEWARRGINVNALCPGYIETEINAAYWQTDAGQKLIEGLPRRRLGKREDLDGLLVMLASDSSDFVNGAVIAADDGLAAG